MIITRANHRISLFGGGSDYPEFISKHHYGAIISAAIDSYAYVCIKKLLPFHKYKTKITYDSKERVYVSNKYIRHPIFRNCLIFMGLEDEPLEINFISDAPAGSGLASGSAMIVALLKALYEYKGESISSESLLRNCFYVERHLIKESPGYQDYLPAIYGGLKYYELNNDSILNFKEDLSDSFMKHIDTNGLLFYSGISRKSSQVINKYIGNIADSDAQRDIRYLAEQAYVMLKDGRSYDAICELMNISQHLKEKVSADIVTPEIQHCIQIMKNAGAKAVRLLGGGGGGSVFVLADEAGRYNIIEAAQRAGMIHIPFAIANKGVERIL